MRKREVELSKNVLWGFTLLVAGFVGQVSEAGSAESELLAQKGYSPTRIQNLMQPQANEIYSGEALKWIGMPIGGLFAGQVYIGGDGDLWNWDIHNIQTMNPGGAGDKFYRTPMDPKQYKRIDQGFALRIARGDGTPSLFPLNKKGFSDITFSGSYPMAQVTYEDAKCPLTVTLKAYSPFEPLASEFSSWPAVVLRYTVTNPSKQPVQAVLGGWLQNTAGFWRGKDKIRHVNQTISTADLAGISISAEPLPGKGSYAEADAGDMALVLLNPKDKVILSAACPTGTLPLKTGEERADAPAGEKLVGSIAEEITLKPGESKTCAFALTWFFPNVSKGPQAYQTLKDINRSKHSYAREFASARDVAEKLAARDTETYSRTQLWVDTWNDSTIPAWFRNRVFINVSTLATTAWIRLYTPENPALDGRIYCWEGVYLGDGTCTHVLQYEQAIGKVFPDIARGEREQVDYGLSFQDSGIISYRGEFRYGQHDGRCHAIDGHLGTILRTCREWELSSDKDFLKRLWPRIKKSIQVAIDQDRDTNGFCDGILEGVQYNTLDRIWYGKITWISGLYAAALQAGVRMATAAGDLAFAQECGQIAARAKVQIPKELFRPATRPGSYGHFIHIQDPAHPGTPSTGLGCHVDQLLGVYWADQAGLPSILPEEKVQEALHAIFQNNFKPDFGKFVKTAKIKPSRFYAFDGEAGVTTCDFPAGVELPKNPAGDSWQALATGYFSECWTGQEYPFAANLFLHGMPYAGFAIVDAVHQRYAPEKRNPYNEIEYGNHYTRAMSSYGAYTALCGFWYDAPTATFRMRPNLFQENFKAAFIASEGWGTFIQKSDKQHQTICIQMKRGSVQIRSLQLNAPFDAGSVRISRNGKSVKGDIVKNGKEISVNGLNLTITKEKPLIITFEHVHANK